MDSGPIPLTRRQYKQRIHNIFGSDSDPVQEAPYVPHNTDDNEEGGGHISRNGARLATWATNGKKRFICSGGSDGTSGT